MRREWTAYVKLRRDLVAVTLNKVCSTRADCPAPDVRHFHLTSAVYKLTSTRSVMIGCITCMCAWAVGRLFPGWCRQCPNHTLPFDPFLSPPLLSSSFLSIFATLNSPSFISPSCPYPALLFPSPSLSVPIHCSFLFKISAFLKCSCVAFLQDCKYARLIDTWKLVPTVPHL